MTIVLIGYRGSGKSTVGKRLANELWYTFLDTDAEVRKRAGGRTIREIFEQDGEPAFRAMESQVVSEAIQLSDHVIALGGGAVMRQETRDALAASGAKVIYLKCSPEVLAQRIGADPDTHASRPPLTSQPVIDEIRQLLQEREPVYRAVAARELEVTHLSAEEAARYLVRLL